MVLCQIFLKGSFMVVIRLARGGCTHRPFYSVVAADRRARRDGAFIEKLGFYNPLAKEGEESIRLQLDRIEYWQGHGAQLSDTAASVVKKYRKSLVAQPAA
jgi:small subunit ribosomal protein S16